MNILRSLGWSASANYTEFFLGFLVTILITRILGPSEYGVYSYYVWLVAIGILLVNAGISLSTIKHVAEYQGHAPQASVGFFRYATRYQRNRLLVLLIPLTAIAILMISRLVSLEDAWLIIPLAIASLYFRSSYQLTISFLKGMSEFSRIALVIFIVSPTNLLLVAVGLYYAPSATTLFLVYTISGLLMLIVAQLCSSRMRHQDEISPNQRDLERAKIFTRRSTATVLLAYIAVRQSAVLFLGVFSTPVEVGYFNLAFVLSMTVVALIPGLLDMVLLPTIAKQQAASGTSSAYVTTSFRVLGHLLFLVLPPLLIFASDIIEFLYGDEYLPVVDLFRVSLVAAFILAFAGPAQAFLQSTNRDAMLLRLYACVSVVKLLIDGVAVYLFDALGAVCAFLASSIVVSTIINRQFVVASSVSLPFGKVVPLMLIASLGSLSLLAISHHTDHIAYSFSASLIYCFSYVLLVTRWFLTTEEVTLLRMLPGPIASWILPKIS